MKVKPEDMRIGDRFKHRGRQCEVIATPTCGHYSTWSVQVRVIDTVGLDYADEVEVVRRPGADASSRVGSSPAQGQKKES